MNKDKVSAVAAKKSPNGWLLSSSDGNGGGHKRCRDAALHPAARKLNGNGGALKAKCRVLVVDDHPLVRDWLSRLINQQDDMICCGGACAASEVLDAIDTLRPDLLITDLSLDGTPGIELVKNIKARTPALPVLVLSMYDETLYAERAIHAGAIGYVCKSASAESVLAAIRTTAAGQVYLSQAMSAAVLSKFAGRPCGHAASEVAQMSDRELEIFDLIGHGKSSREIAEALHLSIKTVESYKTRIKDKLGLTSAAGMLQHAVQWVLAGKI
jgi:DNA-binding NarL/FixJ family response regulator